MSEGESLCVSNDIRSLLQCVSHYYYYQTCPFQFWKDPKRLLFIQGIKVATSSSPQRQITRHVQKTEEIWSGRDQHERGVDMHPVRAALHVHQWCLGKAVARVCRSWGKRACQAVRTPLSSEWACSWKKCAFQC